MSATRHAPKGSALRQEKFASSVELRGDYLLGNLVAKRCSVLRDPVLRKLAWMIQDLSTRAGLYTHPTCNQFPSWSLPVEAGDNATGLDRLCIEMLRRGGQVPGTLQIRKVKDFLLRFALDPAFDCTAQAPAILPGAFNILLEIYTDLTIAPLARVAATSTQKAVFDMLDYGLSCRGLTLAEGTYRVGKSFSSQAWVQSKIGEARYVQLGSAKDDESFYRHLSKALGLAASSCRRTHEMRSRIEGMLREQQIMLVIDEAQYILSQAVQPREVPQRLSWILTSLVNYGVPVALIASRDFTRLVENMKRKLPLFGWEPFYGRLRLRIDLPDALSENDLIAVARALAPEADEATVLLLAGLAMKKTGFISTIEAASSRARFLANKAGQAFAFEHVESAVCEIDRSYRKAAPGGRPADYSRRSGGIPAERPQTHFNRTGQPKAEALALSRS